MKFIKYLEKSKSEQAKAALFTINCIFGLLLTILSVSFIFLFIYLIETYNFVLVTFYIIMLGIVLCTFGYIIYLVIKGFISVYKEHRRFNRIKEKSK